MAFKKVKELTYYSIRLRWYESTVTGLQMVIISVPGPICHLDVVVRTEMEKDAFDSPHYGLPHTLEHLIFTGSHDYPYKGILDVVANRCFSQGTNAYTAVDQTVYTISCGGSEGFFRLLPVFMDHIMNPTITEAAFTTEIHHINGEGEDAGVVYCEMQGCENTAGNIAYHNLVENLYHGSSYASNTGGHVAELRRLTSDKVRDFHKKYYRPDNCCVILTGDIREADAFEAMEKVDAALIKHNKTLEHLPKMERPFFKPVQPLKETKVNVVEFPSNDEEGGSYVYLGWRVGEWDDMMTRCALYTMWNYLCESSISPVKKEFVETENPLAGSASGYLFPYKEASHCLFFSNVAPANCEKIIPKFYDLIKSIIEEGIDMERMRQVLKKRKISELSYMEESPHSYFTDPIQAQFLYATSLDSLESNIDEIQRFIELEKKDNAFWVNLLKTYILDTPYVATIAKPSISKGEENAKSEEERLKKQKEEFGEEAIKNFGEILQKAEDENNVPIPTAITIDQFPIPKVEKIPQLPVAAVDVSKKAIHVVSHPEPEPIKSRLESQLLGDNNEAPVMLHMNHYESSFVNVDCFMDTSELSDDLRLYIELYLEAIFDCPIMKNGNLIPHEEVVRLFNEDVVSYSNSCGFSGGNYVSGDFTQLLKMNLKFEKTKYELMLEWLSDFLYNSVFTVERLKISASKLLVDSARVKRNPTTMSGSAMKRLSFHPTRCNHNATNVYKQTNFLESILKRLDSEPDAVVAELNELRRHIVNPRKMRVHVYGDILCLENPLEYWRSKFFPEGFEPNSNPDTFEMAKDLLLESVHTVGEKPAYAFGLHSTDSGYLTQAAPGISDFRSPDRAPLLVVIELLSCLEGPMWVNIRGKGLAYSYNIRSAAIQGLLYFTLYRSGNLPAAFEESMKIIREFEEKTREITPEDLEAAKAGVIYQLLRRESTTESAAICSFILNLQDCPQDMNAILLKQCEAVTVEQAYNILKQYIVPLFDATRSYAVIVTNPNKLENTLREFESFRKVEIKTFESLLE